jgi:hypothetical protein
MKKEDLVKAGFWGGVGLIGGITAILLIISGILIIILFFSFEKDKWLYNTQRFFLSKKENSLSDEWYTNSFKLCEKDLLKNMSSNSYKKISEVSTIGNNGYRKLLTWRFEVDNSIMGSDMYSVNCVVDKIKKSIKVYYEMR